MCGVSRTVVLHSSARYRNSDRLRRMCVVLTARREAHFWPARFHPASDRSPHAYRHVCSVDMARRPDGRPSRRLAVGTIEGDALTARPAGGVDLLTSLRVNAASSPCPQRVAKSANGEWRSMALPRRSHADTCPLRHLHFLRLHKQTAAPESFCLMIRRTQPAASRHRGRLNSCIRSGEVGR